jgi:hypothetical protein
MRVRLPLGGALVSIAVVGCALAPAGVPSGGVTLEGRLEVTDARGTYQLAQALSPYYKENIQRIQVYLRRTDGGSGAEVDLGFLSGNASSLRLKNLRQNASYTVRLAAYLAPDGTTAIDTGDAACETSFTTGTSLTVTPTGGFKLKLGPRTYNGKGGGVLAPSPGGYASPGTAESHVELVSNPVPQASTASVASAGAASPSPSPSPITSADPNNAPLYTEPPAATTFQSNAALNTARDFTKALGSADNAYWPVGTYNMNYPVVFYYANGSCAIKQQNNFQSTPVFPAYAGATRQPPLAPEFGYVWIMSGANTARKAYVYYEASPGSTGATLIPGDNPDGRNDYPWPSPVPSP